MSKIGAPRITVIGTGYVGLVSGTCFAEVGFNVTCMDKDAAKIEALRDRNIMPIYEPGLEEMVQRNVAAGRLQLSTDLADCVPDADVVFIAVGTPQDEDGSADLQYVMAAARDIAAHVQGYTVVVDKSTVPVGTGAQVRAVIAEANPKADVDVVSNPEFLREGAAIDDFMHPDRIVVGCSSVRSLAVMRALYKPFTDKQAALLETDVASAEMIKYASNAFLAVKITFINEMAALCEKVGADVRAVADGMGLDKRIGRAFLNPGPGYGGSCFPKDIKAILHTSVVQQAPLQLVEATMQANEKTKARMAQRITQAFGGSVKGKTIGVWGVAFKANTDDMRDAPALTILPALMAAGANIVAHDPEAATNAAKLLPKVTFVAQPEDVLVAQPDGLVVLTEWAQYTQADVKWLAQALGGKPLVDLRNCLNEKACLQAGLQYTGVGFNSAKAGSKLAAVA